MTLHLAVQKDRSVLPIEDQTWATAMQTALKTQRITLTVKLGFKRLWPNTAKAVDDKGNKIPKSTRIMKLKIGKAPTK